MFFFKKGVYSSSHCTNAVNKGTQMNISIHRVASIKQFTNTIKREDGTVFYTKTLRVEDNKDTWYEITLVSDDKENLEIK
jgi:hypothetical protein